MLYFAYGSNVDWAQMNQRCPLAKFVCRAKLPAHRLAFTLKSATRDCGVADVLPDQTKDVWGVVYELPDNQLKNLDKREGYRPRNLTSRANTFAKIAMYGRTATRNGPLSLRSILGTCSSILLCRVTITKS
jgi:gamma-glutamylcyclotransferase (GGCT)/AIG2-like uncharacterized protein YtfP